ncbi:MAG: hypothetical protein EOM40_12185 [Clostridia bacterium]|nr:hypothetical protein [Clostridia bacterium]NCC44611.1 hypothetical protein [Clostridia bacterium]
MFFLFSFAGWLWEVGLHLVSDRMFVNRGVLSGPWLPIYGTGGVLILTFLQHFFDRPKVLFFMIMGICGIVEYITGWFLETYFQTRWWDYREYIFEIQGRVCLIGLLIFGFGGLAFVYAIAPRLDGQIQKMSKHTQEIICTVLVAVFVLDCIYSFYNPNMGMGVTTPVQALQMASQGTT